MCIRTPILSDDGIPGAHGRESLPVLRVTVGGAVHDRETVAGRTAEPGAWVGGVGRGASGFGLVLQPLDTLLRRGRCGAPPGPAHLLGFFA